MDGMGSVLSIPGITSLAGPDNLNHGDIRVENGGELKAGPITTLDLMDLDVDETGQIPITSITEFTNGTLAIDGFTPDLSNLVTIENISLEADFGGVIEIPGITNLNQASGVFESSFTNSLISFPDLVEINGVQDNLDATSIRGQIGGRIEFPKLTTITGDISINASGENSWIDLSALTQLTNNESAVARITASQGGTVEFSNPNLIRADMRITATGNISANTITTATGSIITGSGALSSNLTNQATIFLNNDTGPVIVDGNLILDTDSRLEITIGMGTEQTGTGKLEINGAATLGGTLQILQSGLYSPQVGDQFEIVTYGSKTAAFQQVDGLVLNNDLVGVLEITTQSITLKVVAP